MRKPTVTPISKKTPGLSRRRSGLMALEPRFMFDGAAVDTAVDALAQAEHAAQQKVVDFLSKATDQEVFNLFNGGRQTADAGWAERLSQIREILNQGEAPVQLLMMDQASQFSAVAAFAANGPGGKPTIFVSPYWMGLLDNQDVANVLVEELGHWIDSVLNPDADTAQDEGEQFARAVLGQNDAPSNVALDDSGWVVVNGERYQVEFASFNFVNAYEMVYDLDNDTAGMTVQQISSADIDVNERWADKEQNLHYFNASASLGVVSISDGSNNQNFSGNDVSAIAVTVGGTNYYGWISRPIKSNGVVRGFYFWTDTRFTSLSAAQADGNQDGDNVLNNRGFVFVVDQAWFSTQIAAGSTMTINNTKDGNDGTITVASVGSSSDRVDSALNSVLTPNSAPAAANDQLTVNEDSGTTTVVAASGLLSNDSDANSDALTVTGFSVNGTAATFSNGTGTANIAGVGSVTINANGSYSFTPVAGYNGAVPPITYTVSDGHGGTATAVLSITVTPANDPPVAVADTATVTEDTPASGLLMGNDSDPDGDAITVQSFSVTGLSGPFTLGTAYTIPNVGTITVNANGRYTFVPAANFTGTVPVINYTINDGHGGTASSTLTLTMVPANDPPVANPDNDNNAAYAVEAGCHVTGVDQNNVTLTDAGSDQTGNVLTNDTDPDASATRTVTAVRSENGNTWNGTTVVGRYGTLTIAANGIYTYDISETNATVNALNVGDVLNEYFTYTITDNAGATASTTLKIVIKGSNDAPVALNDYDSVIERSSTTTNGVTNYGTASGSLSSTGVLGNDTDPDNTTLTVGTVEVSGAATATFSSASGGGTSLALTFAGTPSSLSTSYYVYWLDGGANDTTPVLLYSDQAHTTALHPTAISGNGVSRTTTISSATVYDSSGNAHVLANGDYVAFYTSNVPNISNSKYYEAQISAAPVSSNTTTFSNVSVTSGSLTLGATVSFSGPTSGTGSITNITYNAQGNIATFDVASSTSFSSGSYTLTSAKSVAAGTTLEGQYGYVDVASNGTYTYYLTSNALITGQVFTERFTYTATDGTCSSTAVLNITVNGTTGLVMDDETATTNEDTTYTSNGTSNLLVGDTYNNVALTTITGFSWGGTTGTVGTPMTQTGIGTLTINSDGSYTFAPASNYNGPVPTVLYTASNGTQSGQATLTITITPVDDASVMAPDTQTIPEDSSGTGNVLANDSDVDSTLTVNSYTWSNGTNTVSGTVGSATSITSGGVTVGSLTLNANGSYTFTPASNWNGTVPVITYTTNTGSTSTLTITVTPVNDAPTLDLDANNNSGATGNDFKQTYTNGGAGAPIGDADTLVSDVDDVNMEGATVVLLNPQFGDVLTVGTLPAGISSATSTAGGLVTITLTGSATLADYQAAIQAITFSSTGHSTVDRLLSVKVNDGDVDSNIAYTTIAVSPDARAVTVLGTVVNEASPYVMFEVAGAEGQWVSLEIGQNGTGTGYADLGADFLPNLQYFDGSNWVSYTGGLVQIPDLSANNGKMLVRAGVLQDAAFETTSAGYETLKLTAYNAAGTANAVTGAVDTLAEGMAQIRDDGQGSIFLGNNNGGNNALSPNSAGDTDPNGPDYPAYLDDDRPVAVNSISVNEGSPTAVFTVTGTTGQIVRFALTDGTATIENGTAPVATDGSEDYGPGLEILVNGSWQAYTPGNDFTLLGATTYVRTAIVNDAPYEGQHNFTLGVTRQAAGTSVYGTGNIYDDGTGSYWIGNATAPASNNDLSTNGIVLNDDRSISILAYGPVNEASQYAMFTVTAIPAQELDLDLQAATSGTAATRTGFTYEYSTDGTHWTTYSANSKPMVPASGKVYVRVDIRSEADANYEGAETFALKASYTNNTSTNAAADTSIVDDGTGAKYGPNLDPTTGPTTDTNALDDDRDPRVNSITINEASDWAVFMISTASTTGITGLDITTGTSNVSRLNNASIQYWNSSTNAWTDASTSGMNLTIGQGQGGSMLVRVNIRSEQDVPYEGAETFQLKVVSNTGLGTIYGTGTIIDDGTGNKYVFDNDSDPSNDPQNPTVTSGPGTGFDDDRPQMSIANVSVEEGSTAVFNVTVGEANHPYTVTFGTSLVGQSASSGDIGTTLVVKIGNTVVTANLDGSYTVPAGTTALTVSVATNDDSGYEGPETFLLTGRTEFMSADTTGTGTIKDDGSASDGDDNNSTADDDRTVSVTGHGPVNEASQYAIFTVTATPGQMLDLDLQAATSGTAATRTGFTYEYSTDGTNWTTYSANSKPTVPSSGKVYVRVDIRSEADAPYEGAETFALKASFTNHLAKNAAADTSIVDDGTGSKYGPNVDPTNGPNTDTNNLDDDRTVSVTGHGPVNEASQYAIFTVTATPGQMLDLDLQAATSGAAATRTGFTYEYSIDGTNWTTYSANSKPTVPSSGKVYVRVDIRSESDTDYEGAETFALKASFTTNPTRNAAADTNIVDDGTGAKYGPNVDPTNGPNTNTGNLDDDRPQTPPPPPPVLPPVAPPAPPAEPSLPPPTPAAPQAFASALQPLAPRATPTDLSAPLQDVKTSNSGYQIPVSETAPQGLSLNNGITDQFVQSTQVASKVSMPFDAFIHTNKDAVIKLEAKQADNTPLPKWVQFDPATGVFEVTPPKDFKGKLDLKVIARDDDGREATAMFQMFIGEQQTPAGKPQSRSSFSEKLRMAGNRPITLVRVAEAGPHKVAESKAVKARAG